MKRVLLVSGSIAAAAWLFTVSSSVAHAQTVPTQLDAAGLKSMLSGLGYEVSELRTEIGKEKFGLKITSGGFDIPIGAEIAPSKNYIWLTASLGKSSSTRKFEELLKANSKIQPTMFYISSSDNLMIGLPCENRDMTPVHLKKQVDRLAGQVVSQAPVWQN